MMYQFGVEKAEGVQKGARERAGTGWVELGMTLSCDLGPLLGQSLVLRHLGSHQGMEKPKCQSQTFKTGRDLRHYLD